MTRELGKNDKLAKIRMIDDKLALSDKDLIRIIITEGFSDDYNKLLGEIKEGITEVVSEVKKEL